MRWMDTLSKMQVMRWMDTNTVKCLQVMRWIDKNRHQSPRPPSPLACSNESLAHSYHTNRTNFLPRDMNETAANASAYIVCKGIYHCMTQRLITTVDQQNWVKMMANIVWWRTSIEKNMTTYLFSEKKAAVSAPHGNEVRRKWRIIARM